jgi:CRISPR-associated endonuclease Csn1
LFQEFRLWQWVGNLRILQREYRNPVNGRIEMDVDVTDRFLPTEEARVALFEWLNDRAKISQKEFLKYPAFQLKKEAVRYRWNYMDDDKKSYPCNETRGAFIAAFDRAHLPAERLTPECVEALWHLLYSVDDPVQLESGLNKFATRWGFPSTLVDAFKKFKPFEKDYGAYSAKAIKRLLSLMRMGKYWSADAIDPLTRQRIEALISDREEAGIDPRVREHTSGMSSVEQFRGLPLWKACYVVYNRHSEASETERWSSPSDIDRYLRAFKHHSLRNPIVEQVVLETLRTVRDLWQQEGHIDEIHIELGRELKKTAEERQRASERNSENENTNLRIKRLLMEFFNPQFEIEGVRHYSPQQQELLRIYEEGVLNDPAYTMPDEVQKIFDKFKQREAAKQPTPAEVLRYKLWLEQKYRSPYTGEAIPLARLFTDDYQIEHVIPQARYFDDSLNNKVICEAAVNQQKGAMLGLEYIKSDKPKVVKCAGNRDVRIFSPTEYEQFVQEHYANNKKKMRNLLLEDIPEDFNARQLNDSRYISRLMMMLLSKIVREEGESEATSKNVIASNGNITDRLKKDWGVNDQWNKLILPRFVRMNDLTATHDFTTTNTQGHRIPCMPLELQRGFNKKRIDHRHHAMDAIVIACTTRDIVNYLNNEAAKSEVTRYDLKQKLCAGGKVIRLPWATFPADLYTSLSAIVVSIMKKLRVLTRTQNHYQHINAESGKKEFVLQSKGDMRAVRKPLHEATFYGLVNLRKVKEVPLKTALQAPQRIVERDLKHAVIKLLASGMNEKQIAQYFAEHQDTWYETDFKKVKVYYFTEEVPNQAGYYATREALDSSYTKEKILNHVTDTGVQKILLRHLERCNDQADVAFSAEGIEQMNASIQALNDGVPHRPIYKVRFCEQANKYAVGAVGNKGTKYVEAAKGTNLYFVVYEQECIDKQSGEIRRERSYATIPLRIVVDRLSHGLSPIPESEEGIAPKFWLSPNDLVYVPTTEEIENKKLNFPLDTERIYKMVSSDEKQCFFGSGARVRGQSLTKYGRYPIHKEGKIRYSAQHRAKAFDF